MMSCTSLIRSLINIIFLTKCRPTGLSASDDVGGLLTFHFGNYTAGNFSATITGTNFEALDLPSISIVDPSPYTTMSSVLPQ